MQVICRPSSTVGRPPCDRIQATRSSNASAAESRVKGLTCVHMFIVTCLFYHVTYTLSCLQCWTVRVSFERQTASKSWLTLLMKRAFR